MGFFDKKKGSTITQEALLTPEQQAAMAALSSFSQTGKLGAYTAGQGYTGELGSFEASDAEKAGQNKLMALINSGNNELFGLGAAELKNILTTDKFDPYSETGVYKGFKTGLDRASLEAAQNLKRDAAVTGDLYSSNTGKELGLLAERTAGASQNKLAELYQNFSNQKIAAAGTAIDAGTKQEAIDQGRITLSQNAGALERLLKDAQAKAQYADWLRGRTELSATVDAAKSVMNANVPFGVKSFTTPDSPSPFSNLLNAGLSIAGQAAGAYLTGGMSTLGSAAATKAGAGADGGGIFSLFA